MNFLYQLFSEDLIYALGWTVLHSFWQALAIGLLMAVGMMFLQQKSAKLRYELAAFSLFLVLISSLTTFLVYYETAQVATDFTTIDLQTVVAVAGTSEASISLPSSIESSMQYFNEHIPLVVAIWFLGVCFFIIRLMGGLAYIQRIKHTQNKPAPTYWTDRMEQLCKRLRIRRPVKLVESSLATVPMVVGYLKPVVLMPIGAINGLSAPEVDAILAHELAHVYRNDFLLNIFLSVIEVLFYFNPAVWWIAANVRTERENCCDDIAIKLCGNSLVYAKALLSLQELSQSVPGYAMAFTGPKNQLLQRIKRILSQPRTQSNMFEKFTATCLLMFTVVLFSIGANSYNYNENIQQQYFANEMTALMQDSNRAEGISHFDLTAKRDTIPKSKKQRYIKKSDEGEVELEIEAGDITRLMIDGEEIPNSELGEYDELIDGLIHEMESVPGISQNHTRTHTQSHSTTTFDHKNKKTITTETEGNGQTRIVIQSNGEEPTEIILNDGQEFIFIDGTRLEGGDTAVIIDEKSRISVLGEANSFHKSIDLSELEDMKEELRLITGKVDIDVDDVINEKIGAMEEMLEELKIRQLEMQAHAKNLREESLERQNNSIEEQRELMNEKRRLMNEESAVRREAQLAKMDAAREMANDKRAMEREKAEEKMDIMEQLESEENNAIRFDGEIKNALVKEMLKDGLIQNENDYSFDLQKKSFKVNGKKQSAANAEKYLKLYEKLSGFKMSASGHIKYQNKNGQSKSSFRSSGIFNMDAFQQYSYFFMVTPESFKMSMAIPERIDGLQTLPFLLTPIEFKPNLCKLT